MNASTSSTCKAVSPFALFKMTLTTCRDIFLSKCFWKFQNLSLSLANVPFFSECFFLVEISGYIFDTMNSHAAPQVAHRENRKQLQWNPVNTDTKVTRQNVRIIGVSVLSGFPEKKSRTHVLSMKRPWQAIFYGNKTFSL